MIIGMSSALSCFAADEVLGFAGFEGEILLRFDVCSFSVISSSVDLRFREVLALGTVFLGGEGFGGSGFGF